MSDVEPARLHGQHPALASGGKAYHAVTITDDAAGFAAITSNLVDGTLTYSIAIWRLPGAP